jgi:hypothetical protein
MHTDTMALVELDVAREFVIIGYMAIVSTSGIVMIILTAVGERMFLERMKKSPNNKYAGKDPHGFDRSLR